MGMSYGRFCGNHCFAIVVRTFQPWMKRWNERMSDYEWRWHVALYFLDRPFLEVYWR